MTRTMNILIVNGPNLNLLGRREPEIYGSVSFEDYLAELQNNNPGINISYFQSNCEGTLIDRLHTVGYEQSIDGIIINAGAYSHYSIAIADAIAAIKVPVVEVHISNIYRREEYRHKSVLASACIGSIVGFGLNSYALALSALTKIVQK